MTDENTRRVADLKRLQDENDRLEDVPNDLALLLSKERVLNPLRVNVVLDLLKQGVSHEDIVKHETAWLDAKAARWDIDREAVSWIQCSVFMAEFSRWTRKRAADKSGQLEVGTAAACYNPKTEEVEIIYNPRFMASIAEERQGNGIEARGAAVNEHELFHLMLQHVTARRRTPNSLWNIACFLPNETFVPGGKHLEEVANMETLHDGEVVRIRHQAGEVAATPEHPILVRTRVTHPNGSKKQPVELGDAVWKKAGEIAKGDYVLLPKYEADDLTDQREFDLSSYIKQGTDGKGRSTFSNNAVSSFTLDEDVAWLLGLYVAEGSSSPNVVFSLGSHEHDIIARVQYVAAKMGYKSSLHDTGHNGTQVVLGAVVLGRFLRECCGDGAANKHVPEFILKHHDEMIRRAFLSGLVDGDGCRYERRGIPWITLGTSSKSLAHDVALLLAQDGIGCSYSTQKLKPRFIGETWTSKETVLYNTIWCANGRSESVRVMKGHTIKTQHGRWKTDHQGVWVPVTKATRERYVGPVYNLSDTPKGTYVANGIMVHNCDLAINSLIARGDTPSRLPSMLLLPGLMNKGPVDPKMPKEVIEAREKLNKIIADLPQEQASEWYFNKLKSESEKQGYEWGKQGMKIPGVKNPEDGSEGEWVLWPSDQHGGWDDIPEELRDIVEGKIKHAMRKATEKADGTPNGWGNIPAELREEIRAYAFGSVDWKAILRNFCGNLRTGERSRSIKRIDRRAPYVMPGLRRGRNPSVLVLVDQSGSVSDDVLSRFFGALDGLSRKMTFDVVPFDHTVAHADRFEWKRGSKPRLQRVRGGGTSFDAAIEYANDPRNRGRWEAAILLTDGEASQPRPCRTKLCWVIAPGHKLLFKERDNEMVVQMSEKETPKSGW